MITCVLSTTYGRLKQTRVAERREQYIGFLLPMAD